jgi:hypothetical protein
MTQLVGSVCNICQKRIESILIGSFLRRLWKPRAREEVAMSNPTVPRRRLRWWPAAAVLASTGGAIA